MKWYERELRAMAAIVAQLEGGEHVRDVQGVARLRSTMRAMRADYDRAVEAAAAVAASQPRSDVEVDELIVVSLAGMPPERRARILAAVAARGGR